MRRCWCWCIEHREDFGVRWQSAAATPLFDCGQSFQSGVALRFPPQSKFFWLRLNVFVCLVCFVVKSVFIPVHPWLIHSVPAAVQAEA
jgi:hypothetical protein